MVLLLIFSIAIGGIISGTFIGLSNLGATVKWSSIQLLRLFRTELVQNALNRTLQFFIGLFEKTIFPAIKAVFDVIVEFLLDVDNVIQRVLRLSLGFDEFGPNVTPTPGSTEAVSGEDTTGTIQNMPASTSRLLNDNTGVSSSVRFTAWQPVQSISHDTLQTLPEVDTDRPISIPMDIFEDSSKNETIAHFDVPGVSESDIDISFTSSSGKLVISYTRQASRQALPESSSVVSNERNTGKRVSRSRLYGNFEGVAQLPVGTKSEDVKASMENGVLSIRFPTHQQLEDKIKISIN